MRTFVLAHAAVVVVFLAIVASHYRPGGGWTAFIEFPAAQHLDELARVRRAPHVDEPSGSGYDGQFYAQLAVDPLVRDPEIDRALDNPPYRARRILFSWTAYALGLGRPAWILQIYALQNVIAWLILAWLLLRWFPVGDARSFVLWSGCLLGDGLLASVRSALLDGPSLLLLALAVIAVERRRLWAGALVLGAAGLGRETSLLGTTLLARFARSSPQSRWRLGGAAALCTAPLLIWLAYLRSNPATASFAGSELISTPFAALRWKWTTTAAELAVLGPRWPTMASLLVVVAFVVQGVYVIWSMRTARARACPWAEIALSFFVLGLLAGRPVWEGTPGAITRVTLPLTVGFNVLARQAPWPVIVLGNLSAVPGVAALLG